MPANTTQSSPEKTFSEQAANFGKGLVEGIGNIAVLGGVTSGAVVLNTMPFKFITENMHNHKCWNYGLPKTPIAAMGVVYKTGFASAFVASSSRTVSVAASKNTKKEFVPEESTMANYAHMFTFANADVLSAQIENYGRLERKAAKAAQVSGDPSKAVKIPKTIANTRQILSIAYPLRMMNAGVQYYAIMYMAPQFADFNLTSNRTFNNFIGGASAGAIATALTMPFTIAGNRMVNQTIVEEGQVKRPTTLGFFKEGCKMLNKANWTQVLKAEAGVVARSIPLFAARTALVYGTINTVASALGEQPLTDVTNSKPAQAVFGFFAQPASQDDKAEKLQSNTPNQP